MIVLARVDGWSWDRVAAAMGRSIASVKSLCQRARAELREMLDRLEGP